MEFGVWGLDFGVWFLILWSLSWDLEFELCSSGVQVLDSILGFVVWCFKFAMLKFGNLILEIWA